MSGKKEEVAAQQGLHLAFAFDGVNFKKRIITLCPDSGDINDPYRYEIQPDSFIFMDAALTEMETQSKATITIRIMSWGGSVPVALGIVGRIRKSNCKIITEGYGTIESAATMILACGDERRISRYSTFMHHEASYQIEGRHSSIKAEVEHVEREEKLWAQYMAEMTKKDEEFYLTEGVHIDAKWTPEQLVEFGIVEKIF